jgi:Sec-independent protein translocase protein TatA
MSKFRDKLQTFVFGLSVGLLIACLFFIFKLDDYFRKIDFSILNQKKNVSEEVVPAKTEKETGEAKKDEKPQNKKTENSSSKKTNENFISFRNQNDTSYAESDNYTVLK